MRIGFNLFPYAKGRHGGAEVYLTQVVRESLAANDGDRFVLIGEDDVLDQFDDDRVEKVRIPSFVQRGRGVRIVSEQLLVPYLVRKHRIDTLVSNYVVPVASPCRNVVIVHDMIYKRFPETLEASKRLFWSAMIPLTLRRSAAVVTVSHFSAGEIEHFHPQTRGRVFVTVEGVRPTLAASGAVRPDWLGTRPYLVSVATFGRHKNLRLLIDAFIEIGRERPELDLVIVGAARTPDAKANRDALLDRAAGHLDRDRIRFADHVADGELAYLYAHAQALVLPSLYEGFGLPVVEAHQFGCPVICSDRASLPEVAGDGGLLFDPAEPGALADAIRRLLDDTELRSRLQSAARDNVQRYSWGRAAEQLMQAVRGVG